MSYVNNMSHGSNMSYVNDINNEKLHELRHEYFYESLKIKYFVFRNFHFIVNLFNIIIYRKKLLKIYLLSFYILYIWTVIYTLLKTFLTNFEKI